MKKKAKAKSKKDDALFNLVSSLGEDISIKAYPMLAESIMEMAKDCDSSVKDELKKIIFSESSNDNSNTEEYNLYETV